ncbi:MAG: hypothetical protein Q7J54_05340 [Candidatus Woesearchaeota archaeon]|nr:hypothetical protein [Candidatus Woesearchaeota archaeon]
MKCISCNKPATIILKHLQPYCCACFCRMIEKRVRKFVRINKIFKKGDNICIVDDSSHDFLNTQFLLKSIIKGLPVKIEVLKIRIGNRWDFLKDKKIIKLSKNSKIIIPWTMDDEDSLFLKNVFNSKISIKSHFIKLLINITDDESAAFAKCRGFKVSKKGNKNNIKNLLNEIENKYPGSKFGLLKSSLELVK